MTTRKYIDTHRIQAFVNKVERKKGYKRDSALVLRHLFEECGELSAALWRLESFSIDGMREKRRADIGKELADVVFLAVYIADILGIDMNKAIPDAMAAVAREYGIGKYGKTRIEMI